jgi:hypothetical protein
MATYYKYAERSAEDYVDWGAIGKTMSDTLLKEQANREKMKADIDKASNEFGEVLSNSPQGEHKGMNERAINFASNAQQYQLMQLKNLKAGKLSLKDYLVGRENLKQGANDAFDIIKKYNDKYGEYQQRVEEGEASRYQTKLLSEVEGFGNLSNTELYINPTNGKVSVGKRMLKDPSKPYDPVDNPYTAQMSSDPNDFRSLVDLNFSLSAQIDKYDATGAINTISNSYAKAYQVVTERGPRGAFVVEDDITLLGQMSDEDIKKNFKKAKDEGYEGTLEEYSSEQKSKSDFAQTLNQAIIADFKTNPIHMISTLVDYIGEIPVDEDGNFDENGTMTTIDFTRNPLEANAHTILLKPNPEQPEGGTDVMDTDGDGAQELLDYMTNQIGKKVISQLNKKVQINTGRAPVRATRDDYARADKRRSDKENVNLLADLYYGTDAEIDTALTNLRGTQTVHGPIDKIVRGKTGVSIIAGGKTIPFNFGVKGKRKTPTEFVEGISSEFGIDFSTAVRGANIQNKAFNETAELESTVTVAATPKALARKGLTDLTNQMLTTGKGSDKDLATAVGLDLKSTGSTYSILQDGVELQTGIPANTASVMQALRGVILNDETLIENAIPEIQRQGVTVGESEGNSMERFNNEDE